MTNFAVQSTLGAAAPLVSKEKGSFGNRMDCAGAHIKNNAVSTLEAAAVGGTAYGAARIVATDKYGFNVLTKGLNKAVNNILKLIGKITKNPDFAENTIKKFEDMARKSQMPKGGKIAKGCGLGTMSARFKALGLIAAIALPTIGYIAHNHSYKAGQIDQKYTDKAKFQKTL